MIIVFDPLPADCVAELQMQRDMPGGVVFQPVDLQTSMETPSAGHRLTASLVLAPGMNPAGVADWLWPQIEEAAPVTVSAGGIRARVGEAAALAWVLSRGAAKSGG